MKVSVHQVRESIGITLSVLCSNLRLHANFTNSNLQEDGNLNAGSWDKFLVERASELVANIQHALQADNMEIADGNGHANGFPNGGAQDDMKWMETVLFLKLLNLCLVTTISVSSHCGKIMLIGSLRVL